MQPSLTIPHDVDSEEVILGTCLYAGKDAVTEIQSQVAEPETLFYVEEHRLIWRGIIGLVLASKAVTSVALKGAAALPRLTQLELRGVPVDLVGVYVQTAVEFSQRRIALNVGIALQVESRGGKPVIEVIGDAEKALFASRNLMLARRTTQSVVKDVINEWERACENKGRMTGVATGFSDLDSLTWGLQPRTLNVIGARPSHGKTAISVQILGHAALTCKVPSLMFSLESSASEIIKRIICQRRKLDGMRLRRGEWFEGDGSEIMAEVASLSKSGLHVVDDGTLTIGQIRAVARHYASRHSIGLIVVDYIQKTRPDRSNEKRTYEVGQVSEGLKEMAKELNVPVLAAAQLNRDPERQEKKRRPRISDLGDSGMIDRDADVIMLLDKTGATDHYVNFDLIVAKNRDGPCACKPMLFSPKYTRFEQCEKHDYENTADSNRAAKN